jgi:hypothetical protein
LRGTATHALCFEGLDTVLQRYVDSDMVGDNDRRRSTTWYVFTIGGTTISWISKLQKVVVLSTIEEEYVAATDSSKEMIGYKGLWRNWERSKRTTGCTMKIRVPFILQIT